MGKNILRVLFCLTVFAALVQAQNKVEDEWLTYFEKSNYLGTPRYKETMEYFKKLENNSPYVKIFKFGESPQGRDLNCVIISKDKCFTLDEVKKSGKPVIMICNGIHSGEIEGKDACMLLARDILITKEKADLIKNAILMIIPVFNVDGHERIGRYNRINQNGPEEMGWRTTAQNLNLNRDWMKADAPEMQAMLKLFSLWLPDFFIDTHTTDGADYQYTVDYGIEKYVDVYEETRNWINNKFIPFMENKVRADGFLVSPYAGFKDNDLRKGLVDWSMPPRFSHGYVAIQNRPALLVETHMIKPYKDRVFGTKSMLNAVLQFIGQNPDELVRLNKAADENAIEDYSINKKSFPIALKGTDEHERFIFKGLKSIEDSSEISGAKRITYTKEKYDLEIPFYNKVAVSDSVTAPYAYLIPREWKEIADRLKLHGISVEETKEDQTLKVERYKFKDVKFQQNSYEGRHQVNYSYNAYDEEVKIPAGTFVVKTAQRGIRVILHALEPKGPDSFLRWGFFNAIFEPKEYFEDYVMEKEALKMIRENPILKDEFEKKLKEDKEFRESANKRLSFFYERSPYYDRSLNVYPVMRVINKF
jgi:hypothetical protein